MFAHFMVWANANRVVIVGIMGLMLWAAAYGWFFTSHIQRMINHRRPHRWSADMATRKGKGGQEIV